MPEISMVYVQSPQATLFHQGKRMKTCDVINEPQSSQREKDGSTKCQILKLEIAASFSVSQCWFLPQSFSSHNQVVVNKTMMIKVSHLT